MKVREIIKILEKNGFEIREGKNHSKAYIDGKFVCTIPRHKEVNELTAKSIADQTGVQLKKRK